MNWKNRLTNYNFWISIFSAVLLILQALKIEFNFIYINEIFTAVLGLLVVIGIISDPTRTSVKTTEKTETIKEQNTLPTNQENETDNDINKTNNKDVLANDFQTILNKISLDLDSKIKELENFNKDTTLKLNQQQTKQETFNVANKEVQEDNSKQNELSNPYIDVIN